MSRLPTDLPPADDELTAALVAVELYLAAEHVAATDQLPGARAVESGWHNSAKLAVQSLRPTKLATPARWNTIERIRRSSHGFTGIDGL